MYPSTREIPIDMSFGSKKRQHPDGLEQFSASLPKRLFSSSEAETNSSINNASVSPGDAINSSNEYSASSALINADCSISVCPTRISDAASFKLEGTGRIRSIDPSPRESTKLGPLSSESAASGDNIGFVLSRISSDASRSKLVDSSSLHSSRPYKTATYADETPRCTKESFVQGKGKGIWTYRSTSTKQEGLGCEGELSEVTSEKSSRRLISIHKTGEESGSEKATHVISRRDVSTVSSRDELWHKAAYGQGDHVSRGKQWENSTMLRSTSHRADPSISSMACESASSCATDDLRMEEIRSKQTLSQSYWSAREESSTMPSHNFLKTVVLAGSRSQERIGCKDNYIPQGRPHSEVSSHPHPHKAASEELSPSYVLSSGRMSLEEEARLGRRAPTIDHDFEEYFSSLML